MLRLASGDGVDPRDDPNAPTMTCPICDLVSHARAQLCPCGYELHTGAVGAVLEQVERERARAASLQLRGGLMLILFFPTLWLFASAPVGLLALAPLVFLVELGFGIGAMSRGGRLARAAQRKLRAARQIGELPTARLIE